MRSACLTLAAALLATACGDDGTTSMTQNTTPPGTSGATEQTSTQATDDTGAPTDTGGTADTEPTGGSGENLMTAYGAPCTEDADCKGLIDDSAICVKDILGVYKLPGGYCSNNCEMPMGGATYVTKAPDCFLGGDCVGLDMYFEACSLPCTDNSQCPREDYECRRMPQISAEGDPKYCLMTEASQKP